MFFLRKSNVERLPVAMSGVRMGERALQVGIDDAALAGAIAAKVGLSGHAAIAVGDERHAAKARAAAAAAGVLVDVQVTPLDALSFPDAGFDAVVLHAADAAVPSLEDPAGTAMLRALHRALRSGGRILVLEGSARRGLLGRLRPSRPLADARAPVDALVTAGFRAVRPLAEREGYRFTEGLK